MTGLSVVARHDDVMARKMLDQPLEDTFGKEWHIGQDDKGGGGGLEAAYTKGERAPHAVVGMRIFNQTHGRINRIAWPDNRKNFVKSKAGKCIQHMLKHRPSPQLGHEFVAAEAACPAGCQHDSRHLHAGTFCRQADTTWARTATAISGGVRAPISRPIGPWIRANC